jgi:hypothetical protein
MYVSDGWLSNSQTRRQPHAVALLLLPPPPPPPPPPLLPSLLLLLLVRLSIRGGGGDRGALQPGLEQRSVPRSRCRGAHAGRTSIMIATSQVVGHSSESQSVA